MHEEEVKCLNSEIAITMVISTLPGDNVLLALPPHLS